MIGDARASRRRRPRDADADEPDRQRDQVLAGDHDRRRDRRHGADGALFEVRDSGRGIPADKLEMMFERFKQVDGSDSREKGGTGLGLAICRSIVSQHGGRIWAENVPGGGSVFKFIFGAATAVPKPRRCSTGAIARPVFS